MKKDRFTFSQDRFLLAILLGIVGLVILALVIFFLRPKDQEYGAEDTPAGVTRNYVLALQKGDYDRAYAYIDPGGKDIDLNRFQNELLTRQPEIKMVSVQVGQTELNGSKAHVALTLLHPANGPFEDIWRENSNAILVKASDGTWKIISMPYTYWSSDLFLDKSKTP